MILLRTVAVQVEFCCRFPKKIKLALQIYDMLPRLNDCFDRTRISMAHPVKCTCGMKQAFRKTVQTLHHAFLRKMPLQNDIMSVCTRLKLEDRLLEAP